MTDNSSASTASDRFGLGLGKPNSERRAALVDAETGEPHVYRLTDAEVTRRIVEGAFAIMRLYSRDGRVFIEFDEAIQLSIAANAIAMSEDSVSQFDGIREGGLTVAVIKKIADSIRKAAASQREDTIFRAKIEAQADAAAYPRRQTATPGTANQLPRQSQ